MKSAENQKQPITVTHLQHEFGVTNEMDPFAVLVVGDHSLSVRTLCASLQREQRERPHQVTG